MVHSNYDNLENSLKLRKNLDELLINISRLELEQTILFNVKSSYLENVMLHI